MVQVAVDGVTLHHLPQHQPVEVHARLQDGVIAETEYIIDLAGLLHARARLVGGRPTDDSSTVEDPTVYDLPLARCGFDDEWMWAASCAMLPSDLRYDSRTFYRRDDPNWGVAFSERPIPYAVHPTKGPWRDVMMPAPSAVTHELVWRAVGDAAALRQWLSTVHHIGKRRHSGEGRVLIWTVTEHTDIEDWLRWPFVAGQNIIRPCPVQLVADLPHTTSWHAARPPSWNAANMVSLAINEPQLF